MLNLRFQRRDDQSILAAMCAFIFYFLIANSALAQNRGSYISAEDKEVQIKNILILPVQDNAAGIYARKITPTLKDTIENEHQFSTVEPGDISKNDVLTPDYLVDAPKKIIELQKKYGVDSILATRITQGPLGFQGRMTLFHGTQGRALLDADFKELKTDEIKQIEAKTIGLFQNLIQSLPFQGIILSRTGNQVTVNMGSHHGVRDSDSASIIQILKMNRHPRYGFLVSSDREVIGKIKFTKVDEFLSFAQITFEKEPLMLIPTHKVALDRMIKYGTPVKDGNDVLRDLNQRQDNDVAFGPDAKEWQPTPPPQYGKVTLMIGTGQYSQSTALQRAGTIVGSQSFTPAVLVGGELWFNKTYLLNVEFKQSVFTVNNPLPNPSPEKLNMTYGHYNIMGVYNIPFSQEFFGPRIQLSAGLHKFTSVADESTPIAFTNSEFGGLAFGFMGAMPITEKLDMGLNFKYFWNPTVTESSTKTSGTAGQPSITIFGLAGTYHLRQNLNLVGRFDLEYYNSDFKANGTRPDPATSISHRILSLLGGVEYLF